MTHRIWMKAVLFVVLITAMTAPASQAQYSFDALRLSYQVPGQDPHSMALGSSSVSQLQGFGSWLVNPAVAAQMPASSFSAGIGVRDISQESMYLGKRSTFDDNQTGLSHIGFSYKVPTAVGSLVLGGGYVQTADYNSAFTIDAFNEFSTRIDQFFIEPDDFFNFAYSGFAIDDPDNIHRSVFDVYNADEDIFEFYGVGQYAETIRRGQSGDYSFFLATEFLEDFFVGVSLGVNTSNYQMDQFFIEESAWDEDGEPLYTGKENTGTYNIDRFIYEEEHRISAIGWNAKLGFLYSGLPYIDLGVSYISRTRWNVEERMDAFIQTEFLDQVMYDGMLRTIDGEPMGPTVNAELQTEYSYNVNSPNRIHLGVSSKDLLFVDLSISAERINYSNIQLSGFDTGDRILERDENRFIDDHFLDVWNFRAGAAITAFNMIEPRVGWVMMSNPIDFIEDNNRHFISGGVGIGIIEATSIDLAIQYGFWSTTEDVYQFNFEPYLATSDQDVTRLHATIGLNFKF